MRDAGGEPERRPFSFLDKLFEPDRASHRLALCEHVLADIREYVETSDDGGIVTRETVLLMLSRLEA